MISSRGTPGSPWVENCSTAGGAPWKPRIWADDVPICRQDLSPGTGIDGPGPQPPGDGPPFPQGGHRGPDLQVHGQKTPGTRSFPGRKVRLVCHEGKEKYLLAELALHNLDLVLSDAPIRSGLSIRAYNHFLGECGITFFAVEKNATRIKNSFPAARTMPPWS